MKVKFTDEFGRGKAMERYGKPEVPTEYGSSQMKGAKKFDDGGNVPPIQIAPDDESPIAKAVREMKERDAVRRMDLRQTAGVGSRSRMRGGKVK